jgi:hypothetical protein
MSTDLRGEAKASLIAIVTVALVVAAALSISNGASGLRCDEGSGSAGNGTAGGAGGVRCPKTTTTVSTTSTTVASTSSTSSGSNTSTSTSTSTSSTSSTTSTTTCTHSNGLGQTYTDCHALGTPGDESTYTQTMAMEAATAWNSTGATSTASCGGSLVVFNSTGTATAGWQYTGSAAGHVNLVPGSNGICPATTDPTWN